jgi:hypothetical protein
MKCKVKVYYKPTLSIGGKRVRVADPYTVIIGESVYTMGEHPTRHDGFSQYSGELSEHKYNFQGKRLPWRSVPKEVRAGIRVRSGRC